MPSSAERMDAERKFLEELFTSRFNAYLVAVGLFSVALTSMDMTPLYRLGLLCAGLAASVIMFASLLRTHWLIQRALDVLKAEDPSHPYAVLTRGRTWPPWRANTIMMAIPILVSVIFALQLILPHLGSREVAHVALWHAPM
jgi:hypothetical protein